MHSWPGLQPTWAAHHVIPHACPECNSTLAGAAGVLTHILSSTHLSLSGLGLQLVWVNTRSDAFEAPRCATRGLLPSVPVSEQGFWTLNPQGVVLLEWKTFHFGSGLALVCAGACPPLQRMLSLYLEGHVLVVTVFMSCC